MLLPTNLLFEFEEACRDRKFVNRGSGFCRVLSSPRAHAHGCLDPGQLDGNVTHAHLRPNRTLRKVQNTALRCLQCNARYFYIDGTGYQYLQNQPHHTKFASESD